MRLNGSVRGSLQRRPKIILVTDHLDTHLVDVDRWMTTGLWRELRAGWLVDDAGPARLSLRGPHDHRGEQFPYVPTSSRAPHGTASSEQAGC